MLKKRRIFYVTMINPHSYSCSMISAYSFIVWAGSIVVRALAYCAEDSRFETHFESKVWRWLTVHHAANRDLMEALGRWTWRGEELATELQKVLVGSGQVSPLTSTSPMYRFEAYLFTFTFITLHTSLFTLERIYVIFRFFFSYLILNIMFGSVVVYV